ncbi:hypothetical protein Hamer_G022322 [Homarus americanus]|uniref:Uncharacterized protein n=1 Tax=Homarus americanus TaxID=6706 RepID=A0A8J5MSK3_HOMAM|nr:hypothetical protein Hamer_G022322 [Homarus americanus]
MSFRRHYGTGSYSSSLLTSPLTSNYGSRGLGGYNSSYSTPHSYTPSYGNYGSYGSKNSSLSRSASLPRDTRERSVPRYSSSYSRGTSPARSSIALPSRLEVDLSDSSSSSGDTPLHSINRHHSFSSGGRSGVSSVTPRSYSRDYGTHYSTTKGFIRSSRSKSVGSTGSVSSLSSGYGSASGVSVPSASCPSFTYQGGHHYSVAYEYSTR